jgi:hypothetical protein
MPIAPAQNASPRDGIDLAFDKIAYGAVAVLVKQRARALAKDSAALEAVMPGLAGASAEVMIASARQILDKERQNPRRWFGFGGEIRALNAKAVLLLGRTRRRAETNRLGPAVR